VNCVTVDVLKCQCQDVLMYIMSFVIICHMMLLHSAVDDVVICLICFAAKLTNCVTMAKCVRVHLVFSCGIL